MVPHARDFIAGITPIATGVQPWGEASTVRLGPVRRPYLTNTFNF